MGRQRQRDTERDRNRTNELSSGPRVILLRAATSDRPQGLQEAKVPKRRAGKAPPSACHSLRCGPEPAPHLSGLQPAHECRQWVGTCWLRPSSPPGSWFPVEAPLPLSPDGPEDSVQVSCHLNPAGKSLPKPLPPLPSAPAPNRRGTSRALTGNRRRGYCRLPASSHLIPITALIPFYHAKPPRLRAQSGQSPTASRG